MKMATLLMLINKSCGLNSSTLGNAGTYVKRKKKKKKKEMMVKTSHRLLIMDE